MSASNQPGHIRRIELRDFRGFRIFGVSLEKTNALIGPNNAGKSTILDSIRALAGAYRFASTRIPRAISDPDGQMRNGFEIPDSSLRIPLANIRRGYGSDAAIATYTLFNGNKLVLAIHEDRATTLHYEHDGRPIRTTAAFKNAFPLRFASIPTLAPFELSENLRDPKTIELDFGTRQFARIFRNYWYYNRGEFSNLSSMLSDTWPGIELSPPEVHNIPASLIMLVREGPDQIEVGHSGFGLQVWLQFLTQIIRADKQDIIIIDEPDVYLHPELQRKLFILAENIGGQLIIATHSVEIINECDLSELKVIDKRKASSRTVSDNDQLQNALDAIGSSQNVVLTRLSKDRRVLFFEGHDYRVVRAFARKLGLHSVVDSTEVTVLPLGGVGEVKKIEHANWAFEKILQADIRLAVILDRDYRDQQEIDQFCNKYRGEIDMFEFLGRKEIENYLLDERAICKAIMAKKDSLDEESVKKAVRTALDQAADDFKHDIIGERIKERFQKEKSSGTDASVVAAEVSREIDLQWKTREARIKLVPGKLVLKGINRRISDQLGVSLTQLQIVAQIERGDIDRDFVNILEKLNAFCDA